MVRTHIVRAGAYAAILALAFLAGCGQQPAKNGANNSAVTDSGEPEPQIAAESLGAVASPEIQALYTGEFEATGSEPFWRLDLLNDYAAFTRPGLSDVGAMPAQRDYRAQGARILAGPMTIVLKAEQCIHESGETLPYKAIVQFEGVSYEGCARRGGAASEDQSEWSSLIGPLVPAIDACLAKIDKKPARVTIAYIQEGEQASVRLTDSEGGRYECSAPLSGGAVSYWEAIGDRDVLQGERNPLFTRAPAAAPTGACLKSVQAKNAGGAVIGWFTRKTC
jgi:uncharacterized membrane protein